MTGSLDGRAYIVTGASRGIGLAAAVAMMKRGARVAMFGRDRAALDKGAAICGDLALPMIVDVADRQALVAGIDHAADRFGGLDGIVNNAGLSLASAIEHVKAEDVLSQVGVNFLAAVFGCQAIIPHLRRRGGGRIVNVGSASARHMDEFTHISIYSSTKAAVERFTAELREEVKAENITVTLFSPGGTETAFGSGWDPAAAAAAFAAWLSRGETFDGSLQASTIGEAIAACFELPPGASFDFVELRPNRPMSRRAYAESLYAARRQNP